MDFGREDKIATVIAIYGELEEHVPVIDGQIAAKSSTDL